MVFDLTKVYVYRAKITPLEKNSQKRKNISRMRRSHKCPKRIILRNIAFLKHTRREICERSEIVVSNGRSHTTCSYRRESPGSNIPHHTLTPDHIWMKMFNNIAEMRSSPEGKWSEEKKHSPSKWAHPPTITGYKNRFSESLKFSFQKCRVHFCPSDKRYVIIHQEYTIWIPEISLEECREFFSP